MLVNAEPEQTGNGLLGTDAGFALSTKLSVELSDVVRCSLVFGDLVRVHGEAANVRLREMEARWHTSEWIALNKCGQMALLSCCDAVSAAGLPAPHDGASEGT